MKYQSDGPAVMLGESTSLFPAQLAAHWRSKGIETVLVTHQRNALPTLPDGTRIVCSSEHETRLTRALGRRLMNPVLQRLERLSPRFKQRFTRMTGVSAETELWLPYFADYVTDAWPTVRAVRAQRPRFVFGHEVTTYGLPTALCRGVPRVIFPWGGDVFTYAESSPFHFALTKFSLHAVDLIVPSSTTAARHICERFGVAEEKVHPLSWGVDQNIFKRATAANRRAICARWNIDPAASIILNPRRFRPDWGAFVALEAFMQIAGEFPLTHFISFGGRGTEDFTGTAQSQLADKALSSRFTLIEGDAPIDVCAELMSISDIFVSLLGRGDMRSASVLQAAASGGAPIVSDLPEYREMERLGFAGLFVDPTNVDDVVRALRVYLQNSARAGDTVTANQIYLGEYEDYATQMDKLLNLINGVCAGYAATAL
jgi:glycosyltransferase involved in cell wall biosynthesis